MELHLSVTDVQSCSGSRSFARQLSAASPFPDLRHAIAAARDIWLNKVDINGWLEAFAAHPEIGATKNVSQRCKEEQSAALATASDSVFQELVAWNARYKEKFGFIFIICASGRGMNEIMAELKKRYTNRPIIELEIAAEEEMKIFELRLTKLLADRTGDTSLIVAQTSGDKSIKPRDRMGVLGAHFTAVPKAPANQTSTVSGNTLRTRPPITTHVLDVARGSPASGIEVHLEMWKGMEHRPSLSNQNSDAWVFLGSSITDADGRSGPLMGIIDYITPGVYRISFNTGNYVPTGFFPYVCIVFEVREAQRSEHFHVPLLLSPFSFSTYRGS